MLKRIRKAVVGGFAAGISGALTGFVFTGAPTKEQVAQLMGAFIVAFVGGFYAVWRTPNAPALTV